ncbi:hypothetical protein KA005_05005, partial [bacterium]|nr:hypothetical protein [bacterium]
MHNHNLQRRLRRFPAKCFWVLDPKSRIHHQASGFRHLFCLIILFLIFYLSIQPALSQDEYSFELSEIEKKAYSIGGYIELRPVIFGLDKDAGLYKLKFYNRDEGKRIEEYNFKLQLDGGFEKGIAKFNIRTNSDIRKSYPGWSDKTSVYEGYLALKPLSNLTIDVGKKTSKWGKGYAWNPVAFVDRPKDPDDPELSLEGY